MRAIFLLLFLSLSANSAQTPFDANNWIGPGKLLIVVHKSNWWKTTDWEKRQQLVEVIGQYKDGTPVFNHHFLASTGKEKTVYPPRRAPYFAGTPYGSFTVDYLDRNYYSRGWGVTMPYSIFFNGGVALHSTSKSHYHELGKPASGGCVRLRYTDAEKLFELVVAFGRENTRVLVK